MIRKLLLCVLLLVLAATVAGVELLRLWEEPLRVPGQEYRLTVAPGDSLRSVAQHLYREGVLRHPELLIGYGRLTGADQQIKQGDYLVPEFSTAQSLLQLLQSGKVIQYRVTLPEGITLEKAVSILSQQIELQAELNGADDPRLQQLVQPHSKPEGLFFPDSYYFTRGATDWGILQRAHAAMQKVLEEEWQARAPDLPYATAYDALVMASIIERETGLPAEREQIAGVFVRRLQRGMLLQTDPTVIYGLGAAFDGNLRRQHLRDDSNPFNSYRHKGLPPTPIALPGREAIRAALHPAPGNALFFVARGDGGHVFSATLAEHNRAVRKYQLQRRKDYRSKPGKAQ